MELHLALRNIVKTDGPSIITEGRLVNILCDFQAFDAIPASKYVMRAIIDDGYSKKLLQCAKWDMAAQQLSGQFAMTTGFQQDIVWTIFQSLAYGLGWINTISSSQPQGVAPQPVQHKYASLSPNASSEEVNAYFNSIIERKSETEKAMGVTFTNVTCTKYGMAHDKTAFWYYLNLEISGAINMRYLDVKVVTYGVDGSILSIGKTSIARDDFKGFGVFSVYSEFHNEKPQHVGRILVYAE